MNTKQLENIATKKCLVELESLGYTTDKTLIFKFNNNKTSYGVCKHRGNIEIIEISKWLHENDTNEDNNVIDTIMHECIHAIGVRGHGSEFKRVARKVNTRFDYNISRATKSDLVIDVFKYIIKCKKCGQEVGRHKKSKLVKEYNHYHCGICGGNFERVK